MYLENIFNAPDIKKKLGKESSDFEGVDKDFKKKMKITQSQKYVHSVFSSKIAGNFKVAFKQHRKVLSEIQKKLDDYLESKRWTFTFYVSVST